LGAVTRVRITAGEDSIPQIAGSIDIMVNFKVNMSERLLQDLVSRTGKVSEVAG